jgi:hypothetical protein
MASGKKASAACHLQQFQTYSFAKRLGITSRGVHLHTMRSLPICAEDHSIQRERLILI